MLSYHMPRYGHPLAYMIPCALRPMHSSWGIRVAHAWVSRVRAAMVRSLVRSNENMKRWLSTAVCVSDTVYVCVRVCVLTRENTCLLIATLIRCRKSQFWCEVILMAWAWWAISNPLHHFPNVHCRVQFIFLLDVQSMFNIELIYVW